MTHSPSSLALLLSALALSASALSCDQGAEGGPAGAQALAQIPPEAVPLESLPLESLFPDRKVAVRPATQQNLQFADPLVDGWPSELWAREAEQLLTDTFTAALGGASLPGGITAEGFRGASALVGEWQALDAHGDVLAEPGTGPDQWPEGHGEPLASDLAAQLRAGTAELGQLEEVRVEIVRLRPLGAPEFPAEAAELELRLRVLLAWERDGARAQYNGAWSAHVVRANERLALRELRRHGAELVRTRAPLLADVTHLAFGDSACFPEEYLRNPDDYYFRSDRLTEYDMWGDYGMAIGDVDGDGWEDVYSCTSAGMPNRLFLCQPDGTTREAAAAWNADFLDPTRSALIVDLDGDGRRDLALAIGADVIVAWNDGESFGERTVLAPQGTEDIYGLSAADADGDGDVDVYANCYGVGMGREGARGPARVMRNVPTPFYDAINGGANVYWRNDGPRRFSDATAEVGFDDNNTKFSFSSIWEDLDGDGDLDLYVANDFGRNHLYRNDGGHFSDVASEVGADDQASGMGPSCGDFDLDGDMDIYISNVYAPEGLRITDWAQRTGHVPNGDGLLHTARLARGNTLLLNQGDGTFQDVSEAYGVNRCGWGWGARFLDLDNDRYEDIYAPNGWYTVPGTYDLTEFFWRFVIARSPPAPPPTGEYTIAWTTIEHLSLEQGQTWAGDEKNVVLLNQAGRRFVDATELVAPDRPMDARALAGTDWDRDGRIDLVLKNRNAPRLQLLHNRSPHGAESNWLVLELENRAPNRDAIGAQIRVHAAGQVMRRTIYCGDGFISQTPRRQHFGLGDAVEIEAVEVRWPDGELARYESGFEPNRAYVLARGTAEPRPLEWQPIAALRDAPHAPMAAATTPVSRVVVFAELPMGPVPLPSFKDSKRQVEAFAGEPLLVTFWGGDDEASVGQLQRLAREREALAAAGVATVPMTVDEGPALVAARRTAEGLGFAKSGGYADGKLMLVYEVLLGDILPRTGYNRMPFSMLIDSRGDLGVIYQGPVQVETVLADAAAIEARGDASIGETLSGGRWIHTPSRNFAGFGKALGELGQKELAELYASRAQPASH